MKSTNEFDQTKTKTMGWVKAPRTVTNKQTSEVKYDAQGTRLTPKPAKERKVIGRMYGSKLCVPTFDFGSYSYTLLSKYKWRYEVTYLTSTHSKKRKMRSNFEISPMLSFITRFDMEHNSEGFTYDDYQEALLLKKRYDMIQKQAMYRVKQKDKIPVVVEEEDFAADGEIPDCWDSDDEDDELIVKLSLDEANSNSSKTTCQFYSLNEDESNLEEIADAYMLHVSRLSKYTSVYCSGITAKTKFTEEFPRRLKEFNSTIDPRTILRIQKYYIERLGMHDAATPQMKMFSINVDFIPLQWMKDKVAEMFGNLNATINRPILEPSDLLSNLFFAGVIYYVIAYGMIRSPKWMKIVIFALGVISIKEFLYEDSTLSNSVVLLMKLLGQNSVNSVFGMNEKHKEYEAEMEDLFGSGSPEDGARPQIAMSELTNIAGVLYIGIVTKMFGVPPPEKILSHITSFWRARPAIEDLLSMCVQGIEYLLNLMIVKYSSYEPLSLISTKCVKFDELIKESNEITSLQNSKLLDPTPENHLRVCDLLIRLKKEYMALPSDKNFISISRLMYAEILKMDNLKGELEAKNLSMAGNRVEPVCVSLRGGPKVAKTITSMYLARDCAKMDATQSELRVMEREPGYYNFYRVPGYQFYDGYKIDTKVTIRDDYAQTVDTVNKDNSEFIEFMREVGTAPYMLNMAHLAEKGGVYFRSKFVILTTNSNKFLTPSINTPSALLRRMHLNYIVGPHPSFVSEETRNLSPMFQQIDVSKLPEHMVRIVDANSGDLKETNVSLLLPMAQVYHPCTSDGKITGKCITYEMLLKEIEQEYLLRKAYHALQIRELNERTTPKGFWEAAAKKKIFSIAGARAQMSSGSFSSMSSLNSSNIEWSLEDMHSANTLWDAYASDSVKLMRFVRAITNMHRDTFGHDNATSQADLTDLIAHYGYEQFEQNFEEFMEMESLMQMERESRECVYTYPMLEKTCTESFQEVLSRCYRKTVKVCYPALRQAIDFVDSPRWKIAIGILTAGVVAYMGYQMYNTPTPAGVQSHNTSDKLGVPRVKEKWVSPKAASKPAPEQPAKFQFGHPADLSGSDLARSLSRRNQFDIHFESGFETDSFRCVGSGFVVKGRLMLMPYHFLKSIQFDIRHDPTYSKARVKFVPIAARGAVRTFSMGEINDCTLKYNVQINDKDAAIIRMPESFQPRKNIISNFIKKSDMSTLQKNVDAILITTRNNQQVPIPVVTKSLEYAMPVDSTFVERYWIRDGYEYSAFTEDGDCGAPLMLMNPAIQGRKIAGFHVCRHERLRKGVSVSLDQDELLEFIQENYPDEFETEEPEWEQSMEPAQGARAQFLPLYTLPQPVISPNKSAIRKSIVYGDLGEPTHKPAILRDFVNSEGETVSPIELAKSKYCATPGYVDHQVLYSAVDSFKQFMLDNSPHDVDRRVLTVEEAVYGIDTDTSVRGLPLDTSPGYPGVLKPTESFKCRLKESERGSPENSAIIAEWTSRILGLVSRLALGIRLLFFYIACLKDEKLPKEKVEKGKARMFECAPEDLTVLTKMYFGAFITWLTNNRIFNGCFIGVNVYSEESHYAYLKLLKFGPRKKNGGAGDYSCYDGSHLTKIQMAILKFINEWYNDGNDKIRELLWLEIINARVIFDDTVVEFPWGLPSGSYMTLALNCLYNFIAYRIAWILLGKDVQDFNSNVVLQVQGDDSRYSVSDQHVDFTEDAISRALDKIGMTYTSELKGDAGTELRYVSELSFLKRKCIFDEHLQKYVAAMEYNAIIEPLNWSKKKNYIDITVNQFDRILNEMSLHPEEEFLRVQRVLVKLAPKLGDVEFPRSLHMNYLARKRFVFYSHEGYV